MLQVTNLESKDEFQAENQGMNNEKTEMSDKNPELIIDVSFKEKILEKLKEELQNIENRG